MRDPSEHTVRSLAEILREHGLETDAGTRPGRNRRRWDDADDTGASRRSPAPPDPPTDDGVPLYGRRATDPPLPSAPEGARGPSTAAIQGLRQSRKPEVPTAPRTAGTPVVRGRERDRPWDRDRERDRPWDRERDRDRRAPTTGPLTSTGPTTGPLTSTGPTGRPATRPAPEDPPTGRVPRITDADLADAEPLPPAQGALAWARFVGELLAAVAVGVGVYFAFTALWELQPYAAVVASPVVVTGLVAGAQAWRHRQGRGALEVRVLAVLLFAGTLLTIAPAGALLSGG